MWRRISDYISGERGGPGLSFDAAPAPAIHDRGRGQSIRYVSDVRADDSGALPDLPNCRWLLFEYADRQFQCPLFVQQRLRRPHSVTARRRPLVWRMDYGRSARIWFQRTGAQQQHLSYGQWRRVDDFLQVAFGCWPETGETGQAASSVGCQGGWLNGRWSDDFYRVFTPLRPDRSGNAPGSVDVQNFNDLVMLDIPPLNMPAPAPFELVHDFDIAEVLTALDVPTVGTAPVGPAFRSSDGRRALIPRRLAAEKGESGLSRWLFLYVDHEILVPEFLVQGPFDMSSMPYTWRVKTEYPPSGLADFRVRDGVDPRKFPLIKYSTLRGMFQNTEIPPAVDQRLQEAVIDSFSALGEATEIPILREESGFVEQRALPRIARISYPVRIFKKASIDTLTMTLFSDLESESGRKASFEASIFDDTPPDFVARRGRAIREVGCWRIDMDAATVLNTLTGQQMKHLGSASEHLAGRQTGAMDNPDDWMVFEYSDGGFRYELCVKAICEIKNAILAPEWHVDLNVSAALRAKHAASTFDVMSFETWCRIKEFVFDVFTVWPETGRTGCEPAHVRICGGWLHGKWHARLRYQSDLNLWDADAGQPGRQKGISAGWFDAVPLEGEGAAADERTHRWTFVQGPETSVETDLQLQGILTNETMTPSASALQSGQATKVSYLVRDDGLASTFPAKLDHKRPHHSGPGFDAAYADEDVVGHISCQSGFVRWEFTLGHIYKLRSRTDGSKSRNDIVLWRRLVQNLSEAYLSWPAEWQPTILEDESRREEVGAQGEQPSPRPSQSIQVGHFRSDRICIKGSYLAGRFRTIAELRIWLED